VCGKTANISYNHAALHLGISKFSPNNRNKNPWQNLCFLTVREYAYKYLMTEAKLDCLLVNPHPMKGILNPTGTYYNITSYESGSGFSPKFYQPRIPGLLIILRDLPQIAMSK
jgi:hypothetical protein